ncbi:MAG: trehalose-phosphatase [Polyangiaceae bacterium]|nr:trehalose-phosphatase [Polyangiaceae bacterium]
MRRLLARENVELLAQLAWSRVLCAFDFDGTLAPIVTDRERAVMRARTARLFARVCEHYPCAVISGRGRADVAARLGRAPVKYVIGNHGLEPGAELGAFERKIARARALLAAALAGVPGVDIEDKRYTLAVHYRRARQKRAARAAIASAVAALPVRMRFVGGKLVVNVLPERAPNKGSALVRLRALEGASTALYVGDDVTDEDVFALDQPGRLFTVRVGASRSSAARYYLRDQSEVDALLAKLVELRARGPR